MVNSILFQSGTVYRNGKLETKDLLVDGEKISAIEENIPTNGNAVTISLKGKNCIPDLSIPMTTYLQVIFQKWEVQKNTSLGCLMTISTKVQEFLQNANK